MARGNLKSPTKTALSKTESRSKSQNKKLSTYLSSLSDNTDSDQMEFDITPVNSLTGSLSPSLKNNGKDTKGLSVTQFIDYKNDKKGGNSPGVSVDKKEFTNLIKGAFSSTDMDAEIIIEDASYIGSNMDLDDLNNLHNDRKTQDSKGNSTSKIRAKRSYKSILSFFRRSNAEEEAKETISLQNIETISPASEGIISGNMESYFNRMNDSHMHNNRSGLSRTNSLNNGSNASTVQNQIIAMIHKCEAECASLENKIYLLETNYLNQYPESTGLTRGWNRCGILSNSGDLSSNGLNNKSRKLSAGRGKTMFGYNVSEVLPSDRLFSLTSYDRKSYNDVKSQGNNDKS